MHRGLAAAFAVLIATAFVPALAQSSSITEPALGSAQVLAATGGATLNASNVTAWADSFFDGALRKGDIAGAIVVVVKGGEVLLAEGYGYADVRKRVPMYPTNTVVRVASLSKLLTWTAVMQLVQGGKINLDASVDRYLDFRLPPAFGEPISMRELMTHSAGFEDHWPRAREPGARPLSLGEYLKTTAPPKRVWPPGAVVAYSNYGCELAAYIVERTSGEPFADYVNQHILVPLGMTHSTFQTPPPPGMQAHISREYGLASSGTPSPPFLKNPVPDPASDFATTGSDMANFMSAYLLHGSFGGHQLLEPSTVSTMFRPTTAPVPGAALGFWHTDYNGYWVVGHTGDGDAGAHAGLWLLPNEGVGIFIALNSHGKTEGLLPAAMYLRRTFFHEFMNRYFPALAAVHLPTLPTAKKDAELVSGEYVMARREVGNFMEARAAFIDFLALKLDIRANPDGTITTPSFMTFSRKPKTWREVEHGVWHELHKDTYLYVRTKAGVIQAVWLSGEPYWFYQPVPWWRAVYWNVPLIVVAAILLLFSALARSIQAVRRILSAVSRLQGSRSPRITSWFVLVALIYLAAWALVFALDLPTQQGGEVWIRLLQLVGLSVTAGALASTWDTIRVIRAGRNAWTRAESLQVTIALLAVVWFSYTFHLISISLNY